MIVILCPTFKDAIYSFYRYVFDLRDYMGEWSIKRLFPSEYCVETDDDLRYIFIDEHFEKAFEGMCADFISMDEFFLVYLEGV